MRLNKRRIAGSRQSARFMSKADSAFRTSIPYALDWQTLPIVIS
jgi:hypothetical protein